MTKARDIASAAPAPSTVSATEIGYLDGVSSAIQTQLDAKVAKSLVDAKGDLLVGSANDTVSRLAVASTAGYVLTVDSAEATGVKWAAAATSSGPAFRAYKTTDQNINGSTWTEVSFNAESFDTDNCFASNRFTPTKAGYYQINAFMYGYQSSSQKAYAAIYKNGSFLSYLGSGVPDDQNWKELWASGGDVVYLNGSSDYVSLYGYFASTTTPRYIGQNGTFLSGVWIRS